MTRERRLGAAAVGMGLVLAVSACGGSSAPSRSSYESQAGAICKSYNPKLQAAGTAIAKSTTEAQAEKTVAAAVALAQQAQEKLKALPLPSGNNGALTKALDAQQSQVNDLGKVLRAIKANSASALKAALATGNSATVTMNNDFDAAGLKACATGSPSSG